MVKGSTLSVRDIVVALFLWFNLDFRKNARDFREILVYSASGSDKTIVHFGIRGLCRANGLYEAVTNEMIFKVLNG